MPTTACRRHRNARPRCFQSSASQVRSVADVVTAVAKGDRGRRDDLLARVVGSEPSMQLHGGAEEAFAAGRGQQRAGVGIQRSAFPAPATFLLGRERHPCDAAWIGWHGQRRDDVAGALCGHAVQQLRGRQPLTARFDPQHARIEPLEDRVLEAEHRARRADEREHQARGDAQQPVQLEDRVAHGDRFLQPTSAQRRSRLW